ncbi:MAG: YkgJ family cysteine cluster protein [Candidatus Hydrogenedentota bacterium]
MKLADTKDDESLAKLSVVYDAWTEAETRDRASWPAEFRCPNPCSKCCERSAALPVTAIEAREAARGVAALDPGLRDRIRQRIAALSARISTGEPAEVATDLIGAVHAAVGRLDAKPQDVEPVNLMGPCPLLENGRCSIYESRPLVCRAYGFAADGEGVYFGCEVLEPVLRTSGTMNLPSLKAAMDLVPGTTVRDRAGRALPDAGMLAELLDRLLEPVGREGAGPA